MKILVMLNSGGPLMIIENVLLNGNVICSWINETKRQFNIFNPKMLRIGEVN
jgi:uncharacterized protein YodC (DUF2158 family)